MINENSLTFEHYDVQRRDRTLNRRTGISRDKEITIRYRHHRCYRFVAPCDGSGMQHISLMVTLRYETEYNNHKHQHYWDSNRYGGGAKPG